MIFTRTSYKEFIRKYDWKGVKKSEVMKVMRKALWLVSFSILILFFTSKLYALDATLSVHISPPWVEATVEAHTLDKEKIISSLEDGLTSEIFFQFKVYNINRGFFSFLGDRLVVEKKLSYIAFKDFFLNQYVVQTEDQLRIYFNSVDSFLHQFATITDEHLIKAQQINTADYYLRARVSINPVKLEPPLHIISLFSSIGRTSPWVEYRFSGTREDSE